MRRNDRAEELEDNPEKAGQAQHPKKISIKISHDYEQHEVEGKSKGASDGAWFRRKDKSASKGTLWLFKQALGFREGGVSTEVHAELLAIKEAYAGELFKLIIPENVPKTRLVVNENAESNSNEDSLEIIVKFSLASKQIRDFHDLEMVNINNQESIATYGVQVAKAIIAAVVLGDSDIKPANLGISPTEKKFYKVDHGLSLSMGGNDDFEITQSLYSPIEFEWLLDPAYMSSLTKNALSAEYFQMDFVMQALQELAQVDLNKFQQITEKYESLLSSYRGKYGKDVNFIIGEKDNAIADLVHARLRQIKEFVSENRPRLPLK